MVSFLLLLPRASYFYSSTLTFLGPQKKKHNRSQKPDAECGQYKPTGSFFFPECPGRIDLPAGSAESVSIYTVHLLLSDNERVPVCNHSARQTT